MANICKFCLRNKADKKNTHFLTDSIIRTCLNENCSTQREKGLYFDISTNKPFLGFNYQRNATPEGLHNILGREPNDEENEKSKNSIPYSVDYVFCNECEKKFTEIETEFSNQLPLFHSGKFSDSITIRKFFYLQFWRSAVCNPDFHIPETTLNYMRDCLLSKSRDKEDYNQLPITITILETPPNCYTENVVGFCSGQNPYVILMNNIIVQLYDSSQSIRYDELSGINNPNDYYEYINTNENEIKIQEINNIQRMNILNRIISPKTSILFWGVGSLFTISYKILHQNEPSNHMVMEFLRFLLKDQKYLTIDNILKTINKFLFGK